MRYISLIACMLALLVGCTNSSFRPLARLPSPRDLPIVHKIDIQQGNVLTQDMLAQLQPEMDKKKVQFIMGTPIIKDTFNAERWDYIYTFEHGGGKTERRHIALIFEDEKLHHIVGDVKPAAGPLAFNLHQDRSVKVPGFKKRSLLNRLKTKIPFVDEPKEEVVEDDPTVAQAEKKEPQKDAQNSDELVVVFEDVEPASPYADIQAAPGEGIVVPPDAPQEGKKKGFFTRFFDGIGLGADDDDKDNKDENFDPDDRKYRDITNQDDV